VVGTFGYMAPEQFQGRALPASDVYAVAATALTILAGAEPESLPHKGLAIDVHAVLAGQVDPALVGVLSAMLEPDPDRRPRQIGPLLGRLSASGEREQPAARPGARQTGGRRGERRRRRSRRPQRGAGFVGHPLVVVVALLGLTIASIATWALFQVALPLLLTLLSLFFGKHLRQAAGALSQLGRRGQQGLKRARSRVQEQSDRVASARHQERVRSREGEPDVVLSAPPRIRVEAARARVVTPADSRGADSAEPEPTAASAQHRLSG
jgi:hypothetical protein